MMHIDTMFPSNFLKAGDLAGSDFVLCIKSLGFEEFDRDEGGKETRPVLWFTKSEKGLVLNKTNAKMIASLYGDETDAWVGKLIALGSENVPFRGNIVSAIRVRGTIPNGYDQATPAPPISAAAAPAAAAGTVPATATYNPANPFADPDGGNGNGDAKEDNLPF